MTAEARLRELGLELPAGSTPAANYANAVRTGNLMFLAGKPPLPVDGRVPRGRLGAEFDTEAGYRHARSAALDLIAVMRAELGSLDRVVRVVELQGYVNAVPEFEAHPKVLDGASDLMVAVFGAAGVHARSVFGATSLRGGAPVVLRAVIEVRD